MGIAALVLGIVSIIIGFIPFCNAIAFIPALIGVILGIVDIVKKKKSGEKKGIAIAGLILSIIAVVVIGIWIFVFGTFIAVDIAGPNNGIIEKAKKASDQYESEANALQKQQEEELLNYLNSYDF